MAQQWGSSPEGVYAFRFDEIPVGSQVEVTFADGSTRLLEVVGTYDIEWSMAYPAPETGPAHACQPAGTPG